MEQQTIFDILYPKFKIDKPIRLIELFAGYGSQALALKYLGVKFEHWKTCEWAVKSIQAYKDLHFTDDDIELNSNRTKDEMVEFLYQKGISADYNKPMTKDQIKRLSEDQLKTIIKNIAITLLLSGKLHRVSPKCCYYLKKKTAHDFEKETGLKAILGVRGGEGALRKTQYKSCFTKDMKFTPIHDLSDEMLKKIYEKYNIEIPDVYKYVERTGCMGCPYGSYKGDTKKELDLLQDNQRRFVLEYFKESYKVLGIDTSRQMTIYDYLGGNQ